ncbi:MAG: hypothetical protein E6R07_13045 [Nevskiaceae bacterium]|nr:MAG: hypothetical protein E6R07_13045 [Nevskiaceae bacterium]
MNLLKATVPVLMLGTASMVPMSAQAAPYGSYTRDDALQPSVYVGGGVGYNWLNGQPFRDPSNPNHDFSESHATWKGFAGVRVSPWVSLEGQYIDFGAHNRSSDNVKADGWTTDLVLDLPLGPGVTPFAKVGALYWHSDGLYTSNGTPGGTGFNERGTDLTWGGGVRLALMPNLDLRLEYERFRLADAHVDNATAGLQYNF